MLGWGDGANINPGTLQSRAATLRQVHGQLTGQIESHASIELGSWRGDAERAQRGNHRRVLTALERQARKLPPSADALDGAAQSFTQIQTAQQHLVANAASWQYRIEDSGAITSLATGWAKADPRRPFVRAKIKGSIIALVTRLNATDIALATKLRAIEVGGDVIGGLDSLGDKAMDGLEWAGDKIGDGLDWAQDRIEDVKEWGKDVVDDLKDRAEASIPAVERLLDTLGTRPEWMKDLIEKGELPQLAEVLGQGAYLLGQAAGIPANFITGEDQFLFADGKPYLAPPSEIVRHEGGDGTYAGSQDLIAPMMDAYNTHDPNDPDDHPQVQVTAIEKDGQVRYVVAIPGTTESLGELRGWNGNVAGTDWAANLKGVGYGDTAATQSIMHAIDQAIQADQASRAAQGLPTTQGRPEVLLTGHSQGGIIAGNIAGNEEFAKNYNVGGVVSAGSPVESLGVPEHIPVYNYQNQWDPVPRLDGGDFERTPSNVTTIEFPDDGNKSPMHTHAQQTYADNISGLHDEVTGGGTSENAMKQQNLDERLERFLHGDATAYRVPYGRQHE